MATKPDYYYSQSAVIPYFIENGTCKVVLVTTRKKKKWGLPKGVITPGMTPEESAAKEAVEEAGVKGKPCSQVIDEYQYEKWDGVCTVKIYPLEVNEISDEWDEMDRRQRQVLPVDEAIFVIKTDQKNALRRLQQAGLQNR